ncbi:sodium:solute symporter [Siminovitchia terrae]|uniref:Sodium:solute symporter n=1 Tax=Siminovitchia terrae TaxID=1914933 RepID=A0ABQ4L464_SIMTE|nr:sodium:solute symporter family protein [Siminovitchia terrae]GIN98696.1 sodium:solute symporter [Siminovitchia terrae]
MNISLAITFGIMALACYLGIRARKGKNMDMEQWAVGGRSFGPVIVFFLLAGEMFTTFTFLGASGMAYGVGMPAVYAFNCFYFVIAYWLLPPIWRYAKKNNVLSQSDFYVKKYDSVGLGVVVAIIGVIASVSYLVMQFVGLGIIVSSSSYGAISSGLAVIISGVVVTIYVTVSGMHGSAWTAIMKDILLLAVMVFMGFYLPFHYYGGFEPMFKAIENAHPEMLLFPTEGLSITWFVTTSIMLAVSFYLFPHMQAGIFSSKSAKAIRWNAASMPLYQLIIVFSIIIGFSAILQVPGLDDADMSLFKLAQSAFPPWFVGVIGAAGALAALVPSSIVLLSSATLMSKNIYKVWKPKTTDKQIGQLSRALVPLMVVFAVFFALNESKLIGLIYIMAYSIIIQLFPALFFSLLKKNPVNKIGALAGMIVGLILVICSTVTNTTMASLFPNSPSIIRDFDMGLVIMIINFVITYVVGAATNRAVKSEGEAVENMDLHHRKAN